MNLYGFSGGDPVNFSDPFGLCPVWLALADGPGPGPADAATALWCAGEAVAGAWRLYKGSQILSRLFGVLRSDGSNNSDLVYEENPKHGPAQRGASSPRPTRGKEMLDRSLPVKSGVRTAVDKETAEIIVFREHGPNAYHGYVSTWKDLAQEIKNLLIDAGLVTRRGAIR
jgi:hypothetical protein